MCLECKKNDVRKDERLLRKNQIQVLMGNTDARLTPVRWTASEQRKHVFLVHKMGHGPRAGHQL